MRLNGGDQHVTKENNHKAVYVSLCQHSSLSTGTPPRYGV